MIAILSVIPARVWRARNPEAEERRRGTLRARHARVTIGLVIVIGLPSIARAGLGGAALALSEGQQCKKNLQGETQYASMLHDERDQYEQQDAALVIQRDELKQQIQ